MRKFYSLVLIAAGLLIGTNAWADEIHVTTSEGLVDAFNVSAGGTRTIVLENDVNLSTAITIGKATSNEDKRVITLDFNGHKVNSTLKTVISLYRGALYLVNNSNDAEAGLYNSNNSKHRSIIVYGSILKNCNPRTAEIEDLYSYLYIGEKVNIVSDGESGVNGGIAVTFFPSSGNDVWNGVNSKGCRIYKKQGSDPRGVANGVRIDVHGNIKGSLYAMQSNGELAAPDAVYNYGPEGADQTLYYQANKLDFYETSDVEILPTDTAWAPYIYIAPSATLRNIEDKGESLTNSQVALYTSGYARWYVDGATCSGTTGVYMKSGEVTLNGAHIASTATQATELANLNIGVSGSGNAIVVESNDHYSGHIGLNVEAGTTISTPADGGTALLETVKQGNDTEVEHITINGGSFSGTNAIAISQETADGNHVEVFNEANFQGGVTVGDENTPEAIAKIMGEGVHATIDPVSGDITIAVGYSVMLNSYGLATFSAEKKVALADGMVAYAATELNGNNELVLEEMNGNVIPANTGVILWKEGIVEAEEIILNESTADNSSFNANLLKPASEWAAQYVGNAYILHDNMLYLYTGEYFKKNKAFLYLEGSNAPQRIRMVFNQATGVENVEVEAAKAEKFYENGQLFIRRGAEVYNVQGQLVK